MALQKCPLYFGWLSLSARKYGKQFEWHYKSAPYILDSSVFLPGNMVSSLMALKKCPLYFGWHSLSARKYGKQFEWHYKSVPYILDGTVFLAGNMASIINDLAKVPPIFWMAQSFCQERWQAK